MKHARLFTALCAAGLMAAPAMAQEWYVAGSIGYLNQSDSDNSGATGAFTTGNLGDGTTLDVAAGTDYGWTTEFDGGTTYGAEIGARYGGGFRGGVELAYSKADVDTHTGVTLGGGSIDAVDAAAIAGSPAPLGITVAEAVADGRGDISNTAVYANLYYDFNSGGIFQPYAGAGLGFSDVEITYNPSGIGVIDDGETKLAWQAKAGITWMLGESWEAYAEYAYRATDDIEVDNDLFPGTLDIENQQNVLSVGARYRFG